MAKESVVKNNIDDEPEGTQEPEHKAVGNHIDDEPEGTQEPEHEVAKNHIDDEPEGTQEPEGGIFDEDLNALDDIEGPASDFNIGSTLLTTASPVQSWAGQNLEEVLSREHVEKDWGDEGDFESGEVYKSTSRSKDVYGAAADLYGAKKDDVYGAKNDDVYGSNRGDKDVYSGQQIDVGRLKSHERVEDERRGRRSMLEVTGFEDKDRRQHDKFARDFVSLGEE